MDAQLLSVAQNGVKVDWVTCSSAISACVKGGEWEKTSLLLSALSQLRLAPARAM